MIERLSTGIEEIDKMLQGGIPRGFLVAVVGEPGCGKTIFCIHFIAKGIENNEKNIFVTTEESRESIIRQAMQFGFDFLRAIEEGKLVILDALMREDEFSISTLSIEELLKKVIEVKKKLGYEPARLVIDSLSAFWLDKPAMARRYSYLVKKVLYKWRFTVLATSQYAITTSEAFGFGIEHVADGIIRFRRVVRGGVLRRYIIIEKMRQTDHDKRMYEIDIVNGKGIVVLGSTPFRREDHALPEKVLRKIVESKRRVEDEVPG
ncbi:MAG TPA: KaiC domain-containing protein [Thermoproteales archaeon]|nr:KaiC domain-containing protein [Thermoproteales archaeon]